MAERSKPSKPRAARVVDVAQAAGVSVATVSRSFNLPQDVREDVRRHVIETARRLGYSPNPAAKALRLQRTHIVGAVFPTIDYGLYSHMVSRFQQRMTEAGYMTFLLTVGFNSTKVGPLIRPLVERGAEALMVVGRIDDADLVEYLQQKNLPVVCTYSALEGGPFPSIGFDNEAATRQLMEYLLQLGHREFAMLAGPTEGNDRQQARRKAFAEVLREHGIEGPPRIYQDPRGYSLEYGARVLHLIREEHPQVTAIVCNSDAYGLAIISEARRIGLRVPAELSVAGFDDQDFAALLDPPLTTIAVAADEMGELAAEALCDALSGSRKIVSHRLQSRLVVRGSTGPAPTRG